MRVTEKGQVTIPKPIRDKLGIAPGSEVEFVEDGAGRIGIIRSGSLSEEERRVARLRNWIESVRGTADAGLSADDVMLETRGRRLGHPG